MNTGPALSILVRCRRLGIRLENRGGRIWATPSAKLTDELRADLRANRAAILTALVLLPRRQPAGAARRADEELQRFAGVAVPCSDGSGYVDPQALHDPECLAALRRNGFLITSEWTERVRDGLPNVTENEP